MVRSAAWRCRRPRNDPATEGPAFFIRDKKCFVMFLDDHHDDGRLAIWCAAPDGVQAEMVETEPDRFFRPPYVGHRGWLGVHLLEFGQDELAAIVLDAFRTVAPPTLVHRLPSAERAQDVR